MSECKKPLFKSQIQMILMKLQHLFEFQVSAMHNLK